MLLGEHDAVNGLAGSPQFWSSKPVIEIKAAEESPEADREICCALFRPRDSGEGEIEAMERLCLMEAQLCSLPESRAALEELGA